MAHSQPQSSTHCLLYTSAYRRRAVFRVFLDVNSDRGGVGAPKKDSQDAGGMQGRGRGEVREEVRATWYHYGTLKCLSCFRMCLYVLPLCVPGGRQVQSVSPGKPKSWIPLTALGH